MAARGTFAAVSRSWLLAILWIGCKSDAPSPAEITERAWSAHEAVIRAGENAKTCAEAGPAMQAVFAQHRQAFVDAMTLDSDKQRLSQAADYIEKQGERYRVIEARMQVLADRCVDEPTVAAAFAQMESP